MNDRTKRILESVTIHTLHQAVNTVVEKTKAKFDGQADLRKRVETLEVQVTELKAEVAEVKKRRTRP